MLNCVSGREDVFARNREFMRTMLCLPIEKCPEIEEKECKQQPVLVKVGPAHSAEHRRASVIYGLGAGRLFAYIRPFVGRTTGNGVP